MLIEANAKAPSFLYSKSTLVTPGGGTYPCPLFTPVLL